MACGWFDLSQRIWLALFYFRVLFVIVLLVDWIKKKFVEIYKDFYPHGKAENYCK